MSYGLFLGLVIFAAIAAYTPGPNNTLLLACGVNHGFRAAIPMIGGVGLGFPFLIICVGLGLGKAFEAFPILLLAIKLVGTIYMLWLAWQIVTSRPSEDGAITAKPPMSFLQACAFQWINPKAWIMGAYSLSAFTLADHYYIGLATVVGIYVFMGLTSAATWAAFGAALRQIMNDPRWHRNINWILAVLLMASLTPMLWH